MLRMRKLITKWFSHRYLANHHCGIAEEVHTASGVYILVSTYLSKEII